MLCFMILAILIVAWLLAPQPRGKGPGKSLYKMTESEFWDDLLGPDQRKTFKRSP